MKKYVKRSQMKEIITRVVLAEGMYLPHDIYISGSTSANDPQTLEEYRIHAILTLGRKNFTDQFDSTSNPNRYKLLNIRDTTTTNLHAYFTEICDFIDNAIGDGNVLVHSSLGKSRSPTAVMAYLIKKFGIDVQKAYELVSAKRKFVSPMPNYVKQLFDWKTQVVAEE